MQTYNQYKLSVVIPVYNAGNGLKRCIHSLLEQTLKHIEIIFVLDCPTDGSDLIVKEYARKYNNIKIIENSSNLNIGRSRNAGLHLAQGKYIAFCDHDDEVMPEMYNSMVAKAEEMEADIVLGVPEYVYDDPAQNEVYYYPEYEGDIRKKLLSLIIGKENDEEKWAFYFSHGVIWDNIYRREFLNANDICFVDNNKITFEDNLFNIDTLLRAQKVVVHNEIVYRHIINGKNTASTYVYSSYPLVCGYIDYLYKTLTANKCFEDYRTRFFNSVVMYVTGSFVTEIKKERIQPWNIIKAYMYIKKRSIIKEAFRNSLVKPQSNRFLQNSILNLINLFFKL